MKTYIFTTKYNNTSYCSNFTLKVYRVKNNVPQLVTTCKGNTASTRGLESEAFNALIACGEIPKSFFKLSITSWRSGGYYCKEVLDKGVRIIKL